MFDNSPFVMDVTTSLDRDLGRVGVDVLQYRVQLTTDGHRPYLTIMLERSGSVNTVITKRL